MIIYSQSLNLENAPIIKSTLQHTERQSKGQKLFPLSKGTKKAVPYRDDVFIFLNSAIICMERA